MHAWFRNWPEIGIAFLYRMCGSSFLALFSWIPLLTSQSLWLPQTLSFYSSGQKYCRFSITLFVLCESTVAYLYLKAIKKKERKVIPCIHFSKCWLTSRNSMFLFTLQSLQVVIFLCFVQSSSLLFAGICLLGAYWAALEPELSVLFFWTHQVWDVH